MLNLTDRRFGKLVALNLVPRLVGTPRDLQGRKWNCECDCGKMLQVHVGSLTSGNTKSCGCTGRQRFIDQNLQRKLTNSHPCTVHGHSTDRTHIIWRTMVKRCENPNSSNFANYGGRGIKVCSSWLDYDTFLSDMGVAPEGMSIEREDNNRGYSKENCVWATAKTQARNRRNTVWLTYQGRTQAMAAWAEELGISYSAVKQRYRNGKSLEEVLRK